MVRRHGTAALIFVLLVIFFTNPLILHVWNAVEDKQDALLNTWIIAWVGHASVTNPPSLYQTNIFYPYHDTLAFSELVLPQGLLALPVTLATDNPIFGYNLVLLSMLWLDAFGMYLLAWEWTKSPAGALIAGVIFGFNPFNLGNLAQLQLVSLGWLPLAILFLERTHKSLSRRVVTRDSLLFALFFVLQSLSSIYYAFLVGLAAGLYLFWRLILLRGMDRWILARLAVSMAIIGLVLTPFLLPYVQVQRELGFTRQVQESEPFSASLRQFTEVSPQNVLYGRWLAPSPVHYEGGYPLDNLFPGFVAVVLAVMGLVQSHSQTRIYLLTLLAFAFSLALGPRLYLAAGQGTGITLPYRWLYDSVPLLRALRAPVRFEALIMLALAGLGALGWGRIQNGTRRGELRTADGSPSVLAAGSPIYFGLALVAILLVCIEYLSVPAANVVRLPVAGEIPPEDKWLREQPPGVALQLPMMGPDADGHLDLSTQYLTTYHWHATPDGYSGFVPGGRGGVAYELEQSGPRALALLQALDVRYLIVHRDRLDKTTGWGAGALAPMLGLSPVEEFGGTWIYSVAQQTQRGAQLKPSVYLPQPAAAGAPYTAYVILTNTGASPFASKPTDKIRWTIMWGDRGAAEVTTGIPLVTSTVSIVPLQLVAPDLSGEIKLGLEGKGLIGQISLSGRVVVGGESAREIVIPARAQLVRPIAPTLSPGAEIPVRIDWYALNKIDAYYSASVRVVNEKGEKITNVDRQPSGETLLWRPEQIIPDEFLLRLPINLGAGKYRVELLMYDAGSDASVLLLDERNVPQERMTLGEFDVK